MKQSKFTHILYTLFTTGLAYAVNYGITLVLTPYITKTVGTEAYGFVALAKQFAEYAVVITTALNTFAARHISIAYHKNELHEANVYYSSTFWGNVILASGIMSVMLWCILILDRLIFIPGNIVVDVKLLFLFIFINFWVSSVTSVFGCAAYIQDKLELAGIFKTVSYITNALILIIAYVVFPAKIVYVGIGTLASTLIIGFSGMYIAQKYTPELHTARSDFSFSAIKKLIMDGCWMSLNLMGDMLNHGLDLVICNQMLSSLAMGELAIAKTMNSIMMGLYTIVDQAFIPSFLKSYAAGDMPGLLKELKLSMKVSGMFANITFAGFVALGMTYYELWIPGQNIPLVYKLTVITIMTCIPSGAVHPLYYIYTLTVKKMVPCFVTILGGLFNVVGMYVLIKYAGMGVYAVVFTTVIVMFVINFVTNPLYMAYVLKLPYLTFYPEIVRNVISCGVLVLVYLGITKFYMPHSWLTFIASAGVMGIIGIPIHFLIVCTKEQLNLLKSKLKR